MSQYIFVNQFASSFLYLSTRDDVDTKMYHNYKLINTQIFKSLSHGFH